MWAPVRHAGHRSFECRTCHEPTAEGKPLCTAHVLRMPYVRSLPHMRLARGESFDVPDEERKEVEAEAQKHAPPAELERAAEALGLPAPAVTAPPERRAPRFEAKPCRACGADFVPKGARQAYCTRCKAPWLRGAAPSQVRHAPPDQPDTTGEVDQLAQLQPQPQKETAMPSELDQELSAMRSVSEALAGLPPLVVRRVLSWAGETLVHRGPHQEAWAVLHGSMDHELSEAELCKSEERAKERARRGDRIQRVEVCVVGEADDA